MAEDTQITWKDELKVIKKLARDNRIGMKMCCSVFSRGKIVEVLQKKMRVLHISCHGTQEGTESLSNQELLKKCSLIAEKNDGGSEHVTALEVRKMLEGRVDPSVDLVVLQAC